MIVAPVQGVVVEPQPRSRGRRLRFGAARSPRPGSDTAPNERAGPLWRPQFGAWWALCPTTTTGSGGRPRFGGGRPWWKQASGWLLASDPFLCALRRTRVIVGRFSLALRRRGSGTKEAKSKRAKKWVQKEVLRENISAFYRFVAASTHCFLGLSP